MCVLVNSVIEGVYVRERVVSITWVAVSCDDSSSADSCIILNQPYRQKQFT